MKVRVHFNQQSGFTRIVFPDRDLGGIRQAVDVSDLDMIQLYSELKKVMEGVNE